MYTFYIDGLGPRPHVSVGSQALVNSTVQILEKAYPGSRYLFLSARPDVEEAYLRDCGGDYRIFQREASTFKTIGTIQRMVEQSDAVICPWGDGYITSPPHMTLRKTMMLKLRQKPMMLMTSSLGPFETGWKRTLSRLSLRNFDAMTVRDTVTYDYFQEMGFNRAKLLPDTAFVLKPAGMERVHEMFAQEEIPLFLPGEYIGINVSILLYNRMKKSGGDYIGLMCEIVDRVRALSNKPVILIPHQFYSDAMLSAYPQYLDKLTGEGGDDREAAASIFESLQDIRDVYWLKGEYTCAEYKGVIGHSAAFIGGRMHTVIAALSCCVPSVIIEYSHKARGLMDMLSIREYCWSVRERKKDLWETIERLWAGRDDYRKRLETMMPGLIEQAYSAAYEIQPLLSRN